MNDSGACIYEILWTQFTSSKAQQNQQRCKHWCDLLLWSDGSASKLGNGGFRKPWTSMTNPKHQIEVPGFPSIPPKCRCGAAVQQWEVLCRSLRSALRLSAHCRRQLRKLRCCFASDYIAIHSSHNSHWQITESHLNSWGAVHGWASPWVSTCLDFTTVSRVSLWVSVRWPRPVHCICKDHQDLFLDHGRIWQKHVWLTC